MIEMNFPNTSDEDYIKFFSDIWDKGIFDNDFKFAFGRFLVEYCKQPNPDLHVSFASIAEYFLKYYWPQVCRSNLKHNGRGDKGKPTIVQCIEKNFKKDEDGNEIVYRVNYGDWGKLDAKIMNEKIKTSIDELSNPKNSLFCFNDVTYAFQRIDDDFGNGKFFWYEQTGLNKMHRKTPVPKFNRDYGIDINPKAVTFFQKYNRILEKVIILEWAKFLEKFNNTPKLIEKTEGGKIERDPVKARKFTDALKDAGFKTCFYNESHNLTEGEIHADHVIPFSYMREDEIWNYVLSCDKCNLAKSDYLPPQEFLDKLIDRNTDESNPITGLKESLDKLGDDPKKMISKYHADALSDGFILFKGSFD